MTVARRFAGLGFNLNMQYIIGTTLQYPKELKSGCVWNRAVSPSRKQAVIKMCIHFGAVKVVHSKSSDKHEPSLTLRVAPKSDIDWFEIHWWLGFYLQ